MTTRPAPSAADLFPLPAVAVHAILNGDPDVLRSMLIEQVLAALPFHQPSRNRCTTCRGTTGKPLPWPCATWEALTGTGDA